MSTAAKVVSWVVGGVVTAVLLGVGWLWWGLSGGWDGIRPAAQPQDRDVVDAREAGREPLSRLTGPLEEELAASGATLGRAPVDRCSAGQNNWKTKDGWTLSCSQALVLGSSSPASSVQAAATDLDARLRSIGWVPASYGGMDVYGSGENADGRYERPDDPAATLVVAVAAPGGTDPYLWLGRDAPTFEEGDAEPVLEAVGAASGVSVLAVVERTYFEDD